MRAKMIRAELAEVEESISKLRAKQVELLKELKAVEDEAKGGKGFTTEDRAAFLRGANR